MKIFIKGKKHPSGKEVELEYNPAIKLVSKTLTAAEILALDSTLVELLPKPGGRKYYVPFHVILHYRFKTAPYEGSSGNILIGYGPASGTPEDLNQNQVLFPCYTALEVTGDFQPSALLAQTEDAYVFHSHDVETNGSTWDKMSWLASAIENQPLCIGSIDTLTAGDGELSVRLYYGLIDGAS